MGLGEWGAGCSFVVFVPNFGSLWYPRRSGSGVRGLGVKNEVNMPLQPPTPFSAEEGSGEACWGR